METRPLWRGPWSSVPGSGAAAQRLARHAGGRTWNARESPTLLAVAQLLAGGARAGRARHQPADRQPPGACWRWTPIRHLSAEPAPPGAWPIAAIAAVSDRAVAEIRPWQGVPAWRTAPRSAGGTGAAHVEFLASLDPGDIRMRLFYSRRRMERSELAPLSPDRLHREMAFIAVAPDGAPQTLGVARALADADNQRRRHRALVAQGHRPGAHPCWKLIDYQRQRLCSSWWRRCRGRTSTLELAYSLGFRDTLAQPGHARHRAGLQPASGFDRAGATPVHSRGMSRLSLKAVRRRPLTRHNGPGTRSAVAGAHPSTPGRRRRVPPPRHRIASTR